jgi:hypothetical protein
MKVAPNRWVSLTYAMLAVLPIGLLVVMRQYESFGDLWALRHTVVNPVVMALIGIGSLVLSAICFSNRARSQRFQTCLPLSSILLGVAWIFAVPGSKFPLLPMLLYGIASWSLWRSNRSHGDD